MNADSSINEFFANLLLVLNPSTRNRLVEITDGEVQALNLQKLGLTFIPESIVNFIHLRHLNVAWNSLVYLPEQIYTLQNLRNLNISRNGIDFLSYSIDLLIHLEELNVAYNRLTTIPASIGFLFNLKVLKINNNRIVELPEEIIKLQNLKLLDISQNPILLTPKQKQWLLQLARQGAMVIDSFGTYSGELSVQDRLAQMRKRNQFKSSSESTDSTKFTNSSNI